MNGTESHPGGCGCGGCGGRSAKSGRWVRRGGGIVVLPGGRACHPAAAGASGERESGPGRGGAAGTRILIFFGYSGAKGDGSKERDSSNFRVAETLREHLTRRFPTDRIEIICAWHKNTFVKTLLGAAADPKSRIRQLHYVGHGAGGGLYFGYKHPVATAARGRLAASLTDPAQLLSRLPARMKRVLALAGDAGLMSGYFSDALAPGDLAKIRARLAPDALMQIWGCFAGAPLHTFDARDPYWKLFNAAGAPVPGVARHLAKALGIAVTAVHDPEGVHGMNYFFRDAQGGLHTDRRPGRVPQWLWPSSRSVRWITYDATGAGDERHIRLMDRTLASGLLRPGAPPEWLTGEIPLSRAKTRVSTFPACSAVPVVL